MILVAKKPVKVVLESPLLGLIVKTEGVQHRNEWTNL